MQKVKILFFLLSILLPGAAIAQCEAISQWSEQKQGFRKLCFYPTTLRMVNITNDESFNTIVKDIEKLRLFIADNPKIPFKKEELSGLRKKIKAENYADMVQVKQGKQSFYVYVKENHEKPVGFAGIIHSDSSLILIDLEGSIPPDVINQLITGKINVGALSKLYDISKMGQDKK